MFDLAKPPLWNGDAPLVCVERRSETSDSATFVLALSEPGCFSYRPGQFVLVGAELVGAPRRAYSLCSTPTRPETIAITVKRVDGGIVSNWLHDHVFAGSRLKVGSPAGSFFLPEQMLPPDLILISAGCGITPVMSMVRWLIDQGYDGRIHFIHRARDSENVIFGDELLALTARHANFRLHLALSQAVGRSESRNESFVKEALEGALSDVAAARAFLCGPVDYMENVKRWLGDIGLGPDHIFSEAFFHPSLAVVSDAAQAFVLDVPKFDKSLRIQTGQSLLDALEQGGVPITDGCRAGVCGACRCRVTAGTVAASHYEALSSEDITAGYVLACSTTATSDLRVELD